MNNKSSSKFMSLGGILAAITVISVYFAVILPTNKLSLLALSSFMVSIIIIEIGVAQAWVFYLVTSFLSFLLVPDKLMIIPFATFFGAYGIIKYYTEKGSKRVIEYLLKFLFFNINVVIAYYLVNVLFESQKLFQVLPLWAIAVILQIVFLVYDYVYTLFIKYYCNKLRNMLRLK